MTSAFRARNASRKTSAAPIAASEPISNPWKGTAIKRRGQGKTNVYELNLKAKRL